MLATDEQANATENHRHRPPNRHDMLAPKEGRNALRFQKCPGDVSFPRARMNLDDDECNNLVQSELLTSEVKGALPVRVRAERPVSQQRTRVPLVLANELK
jgi:hypothetical protein